MFGLFGKKTPDPDQEAAPEDTPAAQGESPPHPLEEEIIAALRTVFDPEIPVNIYDLGLIYEVEQDGAGRVTIRMTLTAPACPVAGTLPKEVERVMSGVPGVESATVELVWDPPWSAERMSEEARLELGLL